MKIAIAGFLHESNSFAKSRTTLVDFQVGGLDSGPAVATRWADAHHELGGFFQAATDFSFQPVPALTAWAMPSGPVDQETYREILDQLIAALRGCGDVDGVLLALHGAMVVDGLDGSADAFTADTVRRWLGPEKPLAVTLDYHANVSPDLAKSADAVVVYQTYPHVDQRARGRRAGEIMANAVRSGIRPVSSVVPLPMLIHLMAQNTSREPLKSLINLAQSKTSPELLELQFVAGFPYADTPSTGASVVAVAREDSAIANSASVDFAEAVWSHRSQLVAVPPEPSKAVALAIDQAQWPTVLVDLGDNIGGGSAADSTVLAHEIIRQNGPPFWLVLHDPEAVEQAVEAGVGQVVSMQVGGKTDRNAPPLDITGRVRLVHDGRYEEPQARHGGVRFHDQGPTVLILTDRGDSIICNSHRHAPFSLGQLTSLGLDPAQAHLVIVKAAVAFRAAYEPVTRSIIEVDTPGLTAANPQRFLYEKLRRPIVPLDEEAQFP